MDLQLYWQSEEAINFIISVGIPAIAAIVVTIALIIGGTELAARIRAAAKSTRKYIDQPDDKLVIGIEGIGEMVLKRDLDRAEISRLLLAVVDAVSEAKPLAERPPAQEHITDAQS